MKKLYLIPVIILIVIYFYVTDDSELLPVPQIHQDLTKESIPLAAEIEQVVTKTIDVDTKQLPNARRCKQFFKNFSQHIADSHHVLIDALEHELRKGATTEDLLQYSHLYKTHYKSYENLVHLAKAEIAKDKINYSKRAGLLNEWSGFNTYLGVGEAELKIMVDSLEQMSEFGSMYINLESSEIAGVNREALIALHGSEENFNTYLDSPLKLNNHSILSPSILSVIHAELFTVDEYRNLIAEYRFSVHELAIAINSQLPNEYIRVLIEQADDLSDYPAFEQGRFPKFRNLADFAVGQFNVEILQLLASKGVTPTNNFNSSGLNLAFSSLPKEPDYQLTAKQSEMIEYLHSKGQVLKGGYSDDGKTFYPTGNSQFTIELANVDELISKLNFQTINSSHDAVSIPSGLSRAFFEYEELKKQVTSQSKKCADFQALEESKEGFEPRKEMYELIAGIEDESSNIAEDLHEIDPLLYQIWNESKLSRNTLENTTFTDLLSSKKYTEVFDFVNTNGLSQAETDYLFMLVFQDMDVFVDIWNARMNPLPPSSLYHFSFVSEEKTKRLFEMGFDLNQIDIQGNKLYGASMGNEVIFKMLLDNKITEDFTRLGPDLFDNALQRSYSKGKLFIYIHEVAQMLEVIEPSHFAKIERLKRFYPEEYQILINADKRLIPPVGTEMNKYRM